MCICVWFDGSKAKIGRLDWQQIKFKWNRNIFSDNIRSNWCCARAQQQQPPAIARTLNLHTARPTGLTPNNQTWFLKMNFRGFSVFTSIGWNDFFHSLPWINQIESLLVFEEGHKLLNHNFCVIFSLSFLLLLI